MLATAVNVGLTPRARNFGLKDAMIILAERRIMDQNR